MKDIMYLEGEAQHRLILKEARSRGMNIEDISDEYNKKASRLIKGRKEAIIVQGIPESWMNPKAEEYCDYKQKTKELFNRLSIPSPKSHRFNVVEDLDSIIDFSKSQTYVCKPEIGTSGIDVAFGIKTKQDIIVYLNEPGRGNGPFLIEDYIVGDDLRLQVICGKIEAACVRTPAFVKGDGTSSLVKLIEMRQKEIHKQNPANDLIINQESLDLISRQKFKMNDIIIDRQIVQLKRIANMGQGGIAYDISKEYDPKLQYWVDQVCEFLGTGYFAFDLIGPDHKDISKCYALEINLRAEWMHHTFSKVRTHDLAIVVLDCLFKK